jgi:DNA-binding IclR family transcriptional regulator
VASVERALSILDALTEDRVTLAELAKRTGTAKSTLLRLIKSLARFGYVLRLEDGSYRLGSKAYQIGSLYLQHYRSVDVVLPVLKRVVEELQESASFYVKEGDRQICLHRANGSRAVRDLINEGDQLPLTTDASGHVLRAFSGARGKKFDDVRRAMYVAALSERDSELAAMSAPVFGIAGQLMGALSVSGPRYRLEAMGEAQIVPVLFRHARALTRTLGGQVDSPEFLGWCEPMASIPVAPRDPSRR